MPNNISISNVLNVSVASPQAGISAYNTSNLAIFSRETYASTFGSLGYKIYLDPTGVGTDFGTSSNTYKMALGIFSQQPNILNNGGYLVVIPFLSAAQDQIVTVTFPATPASGTWEISYNSNATSALTTTETAAALQTALRLLAGLGSCLVTGSISAGFTIDAGTTGVGFPFLIVSNTLLDANGVAITPVVTVTQAGSTAETIDHAINRTSTLVSYFGVMSAEIPSQIVMLAAAAVIQTKNMIGLFVSITAGDVAPGGMLDLLRSGGFTQSRGLFYDDVLATALVYMASYAGLGFSVNFGGSNTTITMNLKTLSGVQPDPNITQTLVTQCSVSGVDIYVSIQGVSKVLCYGTNDFFDNQYNLQAFAGAVTVAYFNALAQTNTKVPQTEDGMNVIKGAIRTVCEQYVANQFIAPGQWNSPTTFGNQANLLANILQRGYYIYSSPVSQQLAATRATRAAVPVQIAIKYAGAIQSGTCIIYVNP